LCGGALYQLDSTLVPLFSGCVFFVVLLVVIFFDRQRV
jgi:hypothetical protein